VGSGTISVGTRDNHGRFWHSPVTISWTDLPAGRVLVKDTEAEKTLLPGSKENLGSLVREFANHVTQIATQIDELTMDDE
jgi:hypothetical protein